MSELPAREARPDRRRRTRRGASASPTAPVILFMSMSRVLFVVPPYSCWGVQVIGTWPPLQLAYLAAVAERTGHEARIYDAMSKGAGFDEIRAQVERFRPDVVVTF